MLKASERRQRIQELIEQRGVWGINKTELAEEFGVSRMQIYKDIRKVLSSIDNVDRDIQAVGLQLERYFKAAIASSVRLMRHPDDSIKAKGIHAFNECANNFTRFLEAFGYKSQVPERFNLNVDTKMIPVGSEEKLVENIRLYADSQGLSVYEYVRKLFPDEVSGLQLLKDFVSEPEKASVGTSTEIGVSTPVETDDAVETVSKASMDDLEYLGEDTDE